jgi:transcriptional regulator GlxA family with amidase domain
VPAMSHRSVSEIAFATGFKAPSHFNCVDRALSTHRARRIAAS